MDPEVRTGHEGQGTPPAIGAWLDRDLTFSDKVVSIRQWEIADLDQLFRNLDEDPSLAGWQALRIYADRVVMDSNGYGLRMDGRRGVAITAREVVISDRSSGSLAVVVQDSSMNIHFDLRVETFRGRHPFSAAIIGGPSKALYPSSDPDTLAYNIRCILSEDFEVLDLVSGKGLDDWTIGSPFYWLLLQTFQEAFLALNQDPGTARSRFRWVAANAGVPWDGDSNREMLGLGAQAAAMLLRMDRPAHIHCVPVLNLTTELAAIERHAAGAREIETNYDAFLSVDQNFESRRRTASLFLLDVDKKIEITRELMEAIEGRLQTAEAQLAANLKHFKAQGSGIDDTKHEVPGPMAMAQVALEEALEKKKEAAIEKASFAVFEAVSGFASAGAGAAAGAAKAATEISKMAKLVKQIQKITKLLSKVAKALKAVKAVSKLIDSIKSDPKIPGGSVQIPSAADDENLTPTDWKVLKEKWDANFAPYIEDDTLGSAMANYRAEGRILFIHGEAVTNSRQSIIDLETNRAQLAMQVRVFEAQRARIEEFSKADEDDGDAWRQVAILLREQYLSMKRQLMMQVQDYADAYRYWALHEPIAFAEVRLDSSIGSLQRLISGAREDIESTLKTFDRKATVVCHVSRDITAEIPKVIAWQQDQNGVVPAPCFRVHIELGNRAFRGFDHVRILSVEVLFEGLDEVAANLADNGLSYYVLVSDTGTYEDRLTGPSGAPVNWSFTSEAHLEFPYAAFTRRLQPSEASGHDSVVNADPEDASSFLNLQSAQEGSALGGFYNPTPFTTWTLTLPDAARNRIIDWSRVTAVKLRLFGTAMASHGQI